MCGSDRWTGCLWPPVRLRLLIGGTDGMGGGHLAYGKATNTPQKAAPSFECVRTGRCIITHHHSRPSPAITQSPSSVSVESVMGVVHCLNENDRIRKRLSWCEWPSLVELRQLFSLSTLDQLERLSRLTVSEKTECQSWLEQRTFLPCS